MRTALSLMLAMTAGPVFAQAADATAPGSRTGEQVYQAVCAECHGTGKLNAPLFGDAKAWKKLIAEGQRALTREAIKGVRQMPPRGGNPGLTDAEVARGVVFMANAAGGKFKDPK